MFSEIHRHILPLLGVFLPLYINLIIRTLLAIALRFLVTLMRFLAIHAGHKFRKMQLPQRLIQDYCG